MKKIYLILSGIIFLVLSILIISAARLPTVDGDSGTWGTVLNTYLNVSHNDSGQLDNDTVSSLQILNGTIVDADISDITNLTLGEKITFTLGGIIDNIISGWISITGGLNVSGNINTTGNITADYLFADGKVGIGTSSPTHELNVVGDVNVSGRIYTDDGNAALPAYSFGGDPDTGFYTNSANVVSLALNGAQVIQVQSGQLQVPTGSVGVPGLNSIGGASTGIFWPDANNLAISTAGSEILRFTQGGNVGIGTATPLYPLHVMGNGTGNISIWAEGNISAGGFITRTTLFDSSKNVWDYIKDSSYYLNNGTIDHSKFYGYISYDIADTSKTIEQEIVNEICEDVFDSKINETIQECRNETKIITTHPYEKQEGVLIDAEIELLRQGVYELKQENQALKNCIINSADLSSMKICVGLI